MRRAARLIVGVVALLALGSSTAFAQLLPGGHDEQAEPFAVTWVVSGGPSPGGVGAGGMAPHLLISEVVVTPTAGEYIEICNGTPAPIDLSNVYLSDDWFTGVAPPVGYHKTPEPGYTVGVSSDFIARFPAGAVIPPGGVFVIAVDGAAFFGTYGALPDFEIKSVDPGVPDMILPNGGGTGSSLLTNSSEMVSLYYWDQTSDNVCDLDYVQWGSPTSGNGVEKTGLAVDGPDPDAVATPYFPDIAVGGQAFLPGSPATSLERTECSEPIEPPSSNGCVPGGPTPTHKSTWGDIKVMYR